MNFYRKKIVLVMKCTLVIWVFAFMQLAHAARAQRVSLKESHSTLANVLKEIHAQSGYFFLGNSKLYEQARPVSIEVEAMPIGDVLALVFQDQPLDYEVENQTVYIRPKKAVQQPITITGTVQDSSGHPLANATIKVLGSGLTSFSGQDGHFTLRNVPADAVLSISFMGYQTRVVPAKADLSHLVLSLTSSKLDEVSVQTGYQKISAERVTGAYSVVDPTFINNRMETSVMDRLEGSVPGLFMTTDGINIRGLSTVYGNQSPLYVVDGFPYEGSLNYLNPADIINVTILKDAAAASIYGTRAANGVIAISTRKGSAGKLSVNYNSSFFLTPRPDISSLHLLNGSQMVDLQEELFNLGHNNYNESTQRSAQPKALEALYQHEQGAISDNELQSRLNYLRQQDNRQQIESMLMQQQLKQQHYFSVSGGSTVNQFNGGLNYTGGRGYNKGGKSEQVNLNLNDQVAITKWLQADAGIMANISNSTSSPLDALSYFSNSGYMPYEMLIDENGDRVAWNYMKSPYELKRLTNLGLLDETFNPLNEMDQQDFSYHSNYMRLQGGFQAKIIPGLSIDLRYQTERGSSQNSSYYSGDSYYVKTMINNATVVQNGVITQNIPEGGQIYETRGDSKSYTMRAQVNFDRVFANRHQVTLLAGAERRAVSTSSTRVHRIGYDENNLNFLPIDEATLADVKGTEGLNGSFQYRFSNNNYFTYVEDRYVSFYGNGGYTFDQKYNLTGSVRVDNSNLFGTDPKYRYLPLWSIGGSWHLAKEDFMKQVSWLDNLTLRATYGLNGNVAKNVGPFLQASTSYNTEAGAWATDITNPPNRSLRWERTAVSNIGLDYAVLKSRIFGSIDFYNRKSTDLLGEKETDPTNAFQSALINYGSLRNRGIEVAINSVNIQNRNLRWMSRFNFSYNKNKMTQISTTRETVYSYASPNGANKIGYPINSAFNFRWAGLDPENGTIMIYDKDGNVVKNYDANGSYVENMLDVDGLVYSGPLQPSYTIGFTNTVNYKQLAFSVFLIANGGNVIRDAVPRMLTISNVNNNVDSRALNFWRKPGDENIPGILPAPDLALGGNSYAATLWYANDLNTLKADYVKIRDISLSYDLARLLFKQGQISSARLSFQVQNPVSWFRNDQDLDPEAYSNDTNHANRLPAIPPMYMFGINLSF